MRKMIMKLARTFMSIDERALTYLGRRDEVCLRSYARTSQTGHPWYTYTPLNTKSSISYHLTIGVSVLFEVLPTKKAH